MGYADTRDDSCFDIAICRRSGLTREKLYSYFEIMSDDVFEEYHKYRIRARSQIIIPKEVADSRVPDWNNRHEYEWIQLRVNITG